MSVNTDCIWLSTTNSCEGMKKKNVRSKPLKQYSVVFSCFKTKSFSNKKMLKRRKTDIFLNANYFFSLKCDWSFWIITRKVCLVRVNKPPTFPSIPKDTDLALNLTQVEQFGNERWNTSPTYTPIHPGRMWEKQPVHCLIGKYQDDHMILCLRDINPSGQDAAILEFQANCIIQQVYIQRFFHQLQCISRGLPVKRDISNTKSDHFYTSNHYIMPSYKTQQTEAQRSCLKEELPNWTIVSGVLLHGINCYHDENTHIVRSYLCWNVT